MKISLLVKWLPLLLIVSLLGLTVLMEWHQYISFSHFIRHYLTFTQFIHDNFWIALLIYASAYIVVVVLSLPGGSVMTIFGGILFGGLIGGATALISATVGATLLFIAVNRAFSGYFERYSGSWIKKLGDGFRQDEFNYMLFLRLVPIAPFFIVNIVPAIIGVSLRKYFIATLIGMIPGAFAYSFTGLGLVSVVEAQIASNHTCIDNPDCVITFDFSHLITFELIIGFAALGFLSLIPVMLKYIKKMRSKPHEN